MNNYSKIFMLCGLMSLMVGTGLYAVGRCNEWGPSYNRSYEDPNACAKRLGVSDGIQQCLNDFDKNNHTKVGTPAPQFTKMGVVLSPGYAIATLGIAEIITEIVVFNKDYKPGFIDAYNGCKIGIRTTVHYVCFNKHDTDSSALNDDGKTGYLAGCSSAFATTCKNRAEVGKSAGTTDGAALTIKTQAALDAKDTALNAWKPALPDALGICTAAYKFNYYKAYALKVLNGVMVAVSQLRSFALTPTTQKTITYDPAQQAQLQTLYNQMDSYMYNYSSGIQNAATQPDKVIFNIDAGTFTAQGAIAMAKGWVMKALEYRQQFLNISSSSSPTSTSPTLAR